MNPGTFVLILRKVAFYILDFRSDNLSSQSPGGSLFRTGLWNARSLSPTGGDRFRVPFGGVAFPYRGVCLRDDLEY